MTITEITTEITTYRNDFILAKVVALCLVRVMKVCLLKPLGSIQVPWEHHSEVVRECDVLVSLRTAYSQS